MDYNTILKIHEFIVKKKERGSEIKLFFIEKCQLRNAEEFPLSEGIPGGTSVMLCHRVNDCWERGYHPRCAKHRPTGN